MPAVVLETFTLQKNIRQRSYIISQTIDAGKLPSAPSHGQSFPVAYRKTGKKPSMHYWSFWMSSRFARRRQKPTPY